jgi:hypothetical protein
MPKNRFAIASIVAILLVSYSSLADAKKVKFTDLPVATQTSITQAIKLMTREQLEKAYIDKLSATDLIKLLAAAK